MNYRHAYHAGNFADVLKHVILARVIEHLKAKPQAFRVIDTHAGIGRYDLSGIEAGKTGEWRDGIGRVLQAAVPDQVAALLEPYLATVRDMNGGDLQVYPGSPLIARTLMRPGDQLVANELHPEDFTELKALFHKARDSKVLNIDAWVAVKSLLPPKERRGLVLIDPPFERNDEFEAIAEGLEEAFRRFATGIYMIWYPLKSELAADRFVAKVRANGGVKGLDVRFQIAQSGPEAGLTSTGILVINPPYKLNDELAVLLPFLRATLARDASAAFTIKSWEDGKAPA